MASSREKLATVIENATGQGLTMKVGNPQCFVRLASVKKGQRHTVRLCVDWTYQEFLLQGQADAAMTLSVTSDDCCDYERITVKEAHGKFFVDTVARKLAFGGPTAEIRNEEDEAVGVAAITTTLPLKTETTMFRWRFWGKA